VSWQQEWKSEAFFICLFVLDTLFFHLLFYCCEWGHDREGDNLHSGSLVVPPVIEGFVLVG